MATGNLERLMVQRAQLDSQINRAKAISKRKEENREIRRKILAGSYMLRIAQDDWTTVGRELVAANMLSERDRELFGL